MKLRGPGDFFGERQHGLPTLRIANMAEDIALLERARQLSQEILTEDPHLEQPEHRGLSRMVKELFHQTPVFGNN